MTENKPPSDSRFIGWTLLITNLPTALSFAGVILFSPATLKSLLNFGGSPNFIPWALIISGFIASVIGLHLISTTPRTRIPRIARIGCWISLCQVPLGTLGGLLGLFIARFPVPQSSTSPPPPSPPEELN